ncbi:DUF2484 family protein [Ruegeria jejuensis]|uniref:DUF2484 family protein n=1 Tax=Ruegeria jejuensis TaxID=3233338 RepID=UPI00355C008D
MGLSILLAVAWVCAATLVALLPMRLQYKPGGALMLAAPALIVFIGYQHGALVGLVALAAFVSMFRKPLAYFWRKWRGCGTGGAAQ